MTLKVEASLIVCQILSFQIPDDRDILHKVMIQNVSNIIANVGHFGRRLPMLSNGRDILVLLLEAFNYIQSNKVSTS